MSDTFKDHGHPPGWEKKHDPRCQACAESELGAMPCSVTPEMVKAALDEYVQYMVPVSSVTTPYRVDLQNALQAIADHINKSLNADSSDSRP